jgi:hypothetical protein
VRNLTKLAVGAGVCLPLLAACTTGFGSPLRQAVANKQATTIDVGSNLLVRGLIVALPSGSSADKGGVAYIQFTAINTSGSSDQLRTASATTRPGAAALNLASASASGSASASESAPGSPAPLASQVLPVGSTTIPAGTAQSPGSARVVVALDPLTQPLTQGESVLVNLEFANAGTASDVLVPVWGSDVIGSSFLPSSPPSQPASSSSTGPAAASPSS